MKRPVETKVIAATAGSAVSGSTVGTFVIWLLGVIFWHGSANADQATATAAAVPLPVSALVLFILGVIGAAVPGYFAPHTHTSRTADPPARTAAEAHRQAVITDVPR